MIYTLMLYQYAYLSCFSILVGALVGAQAMLLGKAYQRRPWGWAILLSLASAVLCQLGVEFIAPPF